MKKTFIALLACLTLAQNGYALLPPLYQSSNEIKSILSSEELGKKLTSGEVILAIHKNDQGYEILTNRQHLQIDIIYRSNQRPGPAEFDLKFLDPIKNN